MPTTPPRADADLVQVWNINNRALPDYNLINTQRQEGIIQIDARIDKKWFFKRWNLNIYLDVENLTAASVPGQSVILDRPLDADNKPIGSGIIVNPNDPIDQQRYRLKSIEDNVGTLLPSIGVMVEF